MCQHKNPILEAAEDRPSIICFSIRPAHVSLLAVCLVKDMWAPSLTSTQPSSSGFLLLHASVSIRLTSLGREPPTLTARMRFSGWYHQVSPQPT